MTPSPLSVCDHPRYAFIVAIFGLGGIYYIFQPELSISAKTKGPEESHAYADTMCMQNGRTHALICGLSSRPVLGRETHEMYLYTHTPHS